MTVKTEADILVLTRLVEYVVDEAAKIAKASGASLPAKTKKVRALRVAGADLKAEISGILTTGS